MKNYRGGKIGVAKAHGELNLSNLDCLVGLFERAAHGRLREAIEALDQRTVGHLEFGAIASTSNSQRAIPKSFQLESLPVKP